MLNEDARTNRLRGKTFYVICPDNNKYYRTIYVRYNAFTNALIPMISNPVYGIPPDGLEPIAPTAISYLMKINAASNPLQDAF
jgi:hypothetical protein